MIRVLHWINLTRMYRCHLTFENNEEFTHYYLTDAARHVLKHKPNVYSGGIRSPAFLKKMLQKIKPHVIICSNLIEASLMKIMKDNCQHLIYIHHTIWTEGIMQLKIKQKKDNRKKYDVFDMMYFTENENKMWREIGIAEEKLRSVCGLTYMDPLFTLNKKSARTKMMKKFFGLTPELAEKSKTILFIHNNTLTGCLFPDGRPKDTKKNSDEYGLMLNSIVEYAEKNNCYVFTKIGRRSSTLHENALIKKVHQNKRVAVIRPEKDWLLADFLFSDAVINQSYSAAYQESLITNHCTACCYLNAKEIVDSGKYPNLPVVRSLEEIHQVLDEFMTNSMKFDSPEVNQDVYQLLVDTFGNQVENVTEVIMGDLRKKYENFLL